MEEDLSAAHLRLAATYIEHMDWSACIARYDRPATLFYCDPPYWGTEGYGVPFDLSQYGHLADLARPLQPCEPAITGDAVLWQAGIGSDAQHWHIGTLFVALGERWVLHTTAALGASVLQPLAECGAQGLHFEGFYRWL